MTGMRKAVICECASNGTFLLEDCRRMDLEPIVVYPPCEDGDSILRSVREDAMSKMDGSIKVLFPGSIDELVGSLQGEDIVCIIPGSEYGISYADQLSSRLGLPGNDPGTTYRRTTKLGMQDSLKEAGLRYILNTKASTREDVEAFWNSNDLRRVVVKQDMSVGSVGLRICDSLEDAISAMEDDLASTSWIGEDVDYVLLQEFIGGEEYIVNTISFDGVHRVTDLWVYTKAEMCGSMVPIGVRTVVEPNEREVELVDYALKVLDAVGLVNGPSHMELKLDERGPVLIEINARPMGGHFTVEALDEALGHHITNLALRVMSDPRSIHGLPVGVPRMKGMFMMVLVVYESRYVNLEPLSEMVRVIKSFRTIFSPLKGVGRTYIDATADYISSIGSIELISDDTQLMEEDFALLWEMEENMPDLIYGSSDELPPVEDGGYVLPEGDVLVFDPEGLRVHGDDGYRGCMDGERFDRCIMDLHGTVPLSKVYSGLFSLLDRMTPGGTLTVTPSSSDTVPYGRRGMFRILMMANLEFDFPALGEDLIARTIG